MLHTLFSRSKSDNRLEKLRSYLESKLADQPTPEDRKNRQVGIISICLWENYLSTKTSNDLRVLADQLCQMSPEQFRDHYEKVKRDSYMRDEMELYEKNQKCKNELQVYLEKRLAGLALSKEELSTRIKMIINIIKLADGSKNLYQWKQDELMQMAHDISSLSMAGLKAMDLISEREEEEKREDRLVLAC